MQNSVAPLSDIIDSITQDVIAHAYKRSPNKNSMADLKESVVRLVRGALDASGNPKPNWSSIHKRSNWYYQSRYYDGPGYDMFVKRAYESMCALGYLKEVKKGVYARGKEGPSYLTRYEATKKLVSLFDEVDRSLIPVVLGEDGYDNPETIRLQMKDNEGRKTLVPYEDTAKTKQMRERLEIINAGLRRVWVDLELTDQEFIELGNLMHKRSLDNDDGEGVLRLDKRTLYRVFNSESFDRGGRFYGPWWQAIPSSYRSKILINGKRTCEYDFKSFHPAMLYAQGGTELDFDAYDVDLHPTKTPDSSASLRSLIKASFNAMLNAKRELKSPPKGIRPHEWGLTWSGIKSAILAKHHKIAQFFQTDAGAHLQYLDSQLAEEVMLHFATRSERVPVLPVHDSFIAHHGYGPEIEKAMQDAFRRMFGLKIRIDEKAVDVVSGLYVVDADLEELLSYKDWSHERRLDAFRSNLPKK